MAEELVFPVSMIVVFHVSLTTTVADTSPLRLVFLYINQIPHETYLFSGNTGMKTVNNLRKTKKTAQGKVTQFLIFLPLSYRNIHARYLESLRTEPMCHAAPVSAAVLFN